MNKVKTIKDPIYNYIELDNQFMQLVNTPEFQRLRNIRQTSYEALYPSALHNRFVHSLGVFYLGCKAIKHFYKNVLNIMPQDLKEHWQDIEQTFLLACLLHDVGHAPFSHTGEDYYNIAIDFIEALINEIDDQNYFVRDIEISESGSGKPHEAMSALIGLDLCKKFDININRELFVRCIIGLKYDTNIDHAAFLNGIIGLLNGDLIDVDKLDYTIRDAYVTGYQSMTIDLDRLLAGYTMYKIGNNYEIGYKRGALSVIENVIYANDLERRWIQNHPAVLYDCQLVRTLLNYFDKYMTKDVSVNTVFCKEALSKEGLALNNKYLKLLNDADVLAYIKNVDTSMIAEQYLSRDKRFKPLWKAEASFSFLSQDIGADLLNTIQKDLKTLLDILQKCTGFFINKEAINFLYELNTDKQKELGFSSQEIERAKHICEIFQNFQEEEDLPDLEFFIILSNQFKTSYRKIQKGAINVELDTGFVSLDKIMSVHAKEVEDKKFFYVYTTKNNVDTQLNLGIKFFDSLRRNYKKATAPVE